MQYSVCDLFRLSVFIPNRAKTNCPKEIRRLPGFLFHIPCAPPQLWLFPNISRCQWPLCSAFWMSFSDEWQPCLLLAVESISVCGLGSKFVCKSKSHNCDLLLILRLIHLFCFLESWSSSSSFTNNVSFKCFSSRDLSCSGCSDVIWPQDRLPTIYLPSNGVYFIGCVVINLFNMYIFSIIKLVAKNYGSNGRYGTLHSRCSHGKNRRWIGI